jgi:hypothetical protein
MQHIIRENLPFGHAPFSLINPVLQAHVLVLHSESFTVHSSAALLTGGVQLAPKSKILVWFFIRYIHGNFDTKIKYWLIKWIRL